MMMRRRRKMRRREPMRRCVVLLSSVLGIGSFASPCLGGRGRLSLLILSGLRCRCADAPV